MRRMRTTDRRRVGFTLMEVLLVLVILVILGSFAVGMFTNTQSSANIRAAKAQALLLKSPLDMYHIDMNQYPTTSQGLEALYSMPGDVEDPTKWQGPYAEAVPLDPWGQPYQYQYPGRTNQDSYDIWSMGPDRQDGTDDDIGNWE